MNPQEFKKLVKAFSDPASEFLVENNRIMVQVNDEIVDCTYQLSDSGILIDDNGVQYSGLNWIVQRLARIDILANRLNTIIEHDTNYVFPKLVSDEKEDHSIDSNDEFLKTLREGSIFNTGVVYLTSDAGEGKTSFVNQLALTQARKYLNKEDDFLVIPISLGGRSFHRFDDIVMGSLANKFRFPFLNYQSFMELMKKGQV